MTSTPNSRQSTREHQIDRAIEDIGNWALIIDDCTPLIKAANEKLGTLEVELEDQDYRDMSMAHAVVMVFILAAVFVIDYVLFSPVIGFLATFAFKGTPQGWMLELARVAIPIAFLFIELNIAYFRSHAQSQLSSFSWKVGSILFGALVPVALWATFYAALVDPLQTFSLDMLVSRLLLYFLVVLAAVAHYGVIFGGGPILLAIRMLGKRGELNGQRRKLEDLEGRKRSAAGFVIQKYGIFRGLMEKYILQEEGKLYGDSQFTQTAVAVLKEQYPDDIPYFEHKRGLFDRQFVAQAVPQQPSVAEPSRPVVGAATSTADQRGASSENVDKPLEGGGTPGPIPDMPEAPGKEDSSDGTLVGSFGFVILATQANGLGKIALEKDGSVYAAKGRNGGPLPTAGRLVKVVSETQDHVLEVQLDASR